MKILSFAIASICIILLTSFSYNDFTTEDQLAQKIASALKNNDKEALLKLVCTEKDWIEIIDSSLANDSTKHKLKTAMAQDSSETIRKIIYKFDEITKELSEKGCLSTFTIVKITPETQTLKSNIELGKLDIEITCGSNQETISVKIIKTKEGWKILEKLKLIYKE